MDKVTTLAICILSILITMVSRNIDTIVVMILWISILLYSIRNLSKRSALFAFIISFFTFLLGRFLVESIADVLPTDYFNIFIDFSSGTIQFIYKALIVSLATVFIGYIIGEQSNIKPTKDSSRSPYYNEIRKLSKFLVYFTFTFYILEIIERIYFVGINGYFEYYASFSQHLPYLVYKFSSFFVYSVFLYLATLPDKKDAKKIIILYLLASLFKMLIGARGAIIYPLFLVLIYCFIRTNKDPNDPWITSKGKTILVVSAPIICLLMSVVAILRNGETLTDIAFWDSIKSFFYKQGTSYQIIGFVYDSKSSIPQDQIYSIGTIFHIFDGSIVGRMLGVDHQLVSQTAEYALKGDELGSFITYLYNPTLYLRGGAYGSCYIAEAYADLGWIGIVLSSMTVGYLLSKVNNWTIKNVWGATITFFMIISLIRAPRGSAFAFWGEVLDLNLILLSILIHYYAKYKSRSYRIRTVKIN